MNKPTRSIAALLTVMLDNIDLIKNQSYSPRGLCSLNMSLNTKEIITYLEYDLLENFIDNNRPKFLHKHYDITHANSCYYWKQYVKKPRIKWLKYHIKNERNKE